MEKNIRKIEKIWFKEDRIYVRLVGGEEAWQSLLWYPRLKNATAEERNNYRFISDEGIHWEDVDEDISVESFFYDDPEPSEVIKVFKEHPEINVSAFARVVNIPQSLMARYISGSKKMSKAQERKIVTALHHLGNELISVAL